MKSSRFIFLACLALVAVGCGSGEGFSKQNQASKENVFRYPIVTDPTTLDPGIVQDGDTIDLVQNVFEGLVAYGENNTIVPILAEKWDIEDGGKSYIFHIRKGVKFHNGKELTAEDFKWSIERNTQPALNSETARQYLVDINGVRDKLAGKAKDVSGVQVVDPYTLKFMIDKPRPYFLGKLTYPVSWAMCKEGTPIDKEIGDPSQMIGTGPFKLETFVRNQTAVLAAFSDYRDGKPPIDKIERAIIKDPTTRLNKFKSGELDLVMLERQDVAGLKKDPKFGPMLKFFDRPAPWFMALNAKTYKPFADPRVRRAVAMAIDKKQIVDEILEGVNLVADSLIPPSVPSYRADFKGISFDPVAAKKLLADAGYPDPSKMPPLELTIRDSRKDIEVVALAVQSQLAKNLGMPITLKTMEWRAMLEKLDKKEVDFSHRRWGADYLDPENFLSFMGSTTGVENRVNYSNPAFDALTAQADVEMDPDKRWPLYNKAEDILINDACYVPIYFQKDAELISPRVKGMRESVFGHLPHTKVRLEG